MPNENGGSGCSPYTWKGHHKLLLDGSAKERVSSTEPHPELYGIDGVKGNLFLFLEFCVNLSILSVTINLTTDIFAGTCKQLLNKLRVL